MCVCVSVFGVMIAKHKSGDVEVRGGIQTSKKKKESILIVISTPCTRVCVRCSIVVVA